MFQRRTNAATSAAMPMTIQVMGLASSAAVNFQTVDMSGESAALAMPTPVLSSRKADTTLVTIMAMPENTETTVPPTARKPPRPSTTSMMTRTSS